MGHKVSPISFRIGGIRTWDSKWFSGKGKYRKNFINDLKIRDFVLKRLKNAAVSKVEIERSPRALTLNIYSSRPGIIIGRGGTGVDDLKKEIKKRTNRSVDVNVNIQEIKHPEGDAAIIAYVIAEQLEKRISFRRVMKQAIDRAMKSPGVRGMKVMVSGRLDGAEMSRKEWLAEGNMPLHTLRADVDHAKAEAYTTYGVIGVKVWVYKGEVFGEAPESTAR
jgi:small subunit ribosomal protein S3